MWHCVTGTVLLLTALSWACGAPIEPKSVEGLSLSFEGQRISTRVWENVSFHKLHELPTEPEVFLIRPTRIRASEDGHVYIVDYGDMKVKRFGPQGRHVATYGYGVGSGPGELMNIVNSGTIGDSVVFLVDNRQRKISFFSSDGMLLDDVSTKERVYRYVVTFRGRTYSMMPTSGEQAVFSTSYGAETQQFGGSLQEDQAENSPMLLDGWINAYGEDLIYVPAYFPVIIRFNERGEVVYARSTLDLGKGEPPRIETTPGVRTVVADLLNSRIAIDKDNIYVYTRPDSSLVVDLYAAKTGDYRSSIRLPFGGGSRMMNGRVYDRRDSTVAVYAVER